jgi:hypothetical protein
VYFYAFRKSSNIPSAWITLSCLENHLVIVLYNNHKGKNDILRIPRRHFNSSCRIACSCTDIEQSNCVFHCSYYIIQYTVMTIFKIFIFRYVSQSANKPKKYVWCFIRRSGRKPGEKVLIPPSYLQLGKGAHYSEV